MLRKFQFGLITALVTGALAFAQPAMPPDPVTDPSANPERQARSTPERLSEERTGTFAIRDFGLLRVTTDVGSIRVITQGSPAGSIAYRVRIETESGPADAAQLLKAYALTAQPSAAGVFLSGTVPWKQFRGRLWVTIEINAPRNVHLELSTGAGNIETDDVEGRAVLLSSGGNLKATRIASSARLQTEGGHIVVREVGGDLTAVTAGGHIAVEQVHGSGTLRSGGGHLKIGTIRGFAQVETTGGDINVAKAGARVMASSGGGQISFGEAAGSIVARTGGGGIRVMSVAGPMQLETAGGSIYLTSVKGTVSASTESGNITAWFAPVGNKKTGASELQCRQGDIVVYLPKQLALTIEAVIEMPVGSNKVEPDPALPLKVSYVTPAPGTRMLRAEGSMNGGGEVLRLRTVTGDIKLRVAEGAVAPAQLPSVEHRNKLRREIETLQQQERKLNELQDQLAARIAATAKAKAEERTRFQVFQQKWEELWSRPVRVEAESMRARLLYKPAPSYPTFARQNKIEGRVQMDVYVDREGRVEDVKVLSGHNILAQAAQQAVRDWRYAPVMKSNRPVRVVTRVDMEFRIGPN